MIEDIKENHELKEKIYLEGAENEENEANPRENFSLGQPLSSVGASHGNPSSALHMMHNIYDNIITFINSFSKKGF